MGTLRKWWTTSLCCDITADTLSGTVENLQLVVTSGESSLSPLTETKDIGDLVVNAVANGVDIKPTQTFGKENEIIPLNLNASMHDPKFRSCK